MHPKNFHFAKTVNYLFNRKITENLFSVEPKIVSRHFFRFSVIHKCIPRRLFSGITQVLRGTEKAFLSAAENFSFGKNFELLIQSENYGESFFCGAKIHLSSFFEILRNIQNRNTI